MIYQIIDPEVIKQSMMGNDELIKELIEMYIVQSPVDFQALENAISLGDQILIREKAHHIKPTMQYIGATELMNDFQTLENLSKSNVSQAEILHKFQQIKFQFARMLEELKVLSQNPSRL